MQRFNLHLQKKVYMFSCGTRRSLTTPLSIVLIWAMLLFSAQFSTAQNVATATQDSVAVKTKKWYDKINLRGYMQVRYNRLLETNPNLKCESCDRSWGDNGGFFIRRMRLIFFGNLSDHVYMYIQPDLASSVSTTSLHFAQLRDAYFDVSVDAKKEFRFRIGQSKVPYGFENMQSSQNRLPLDRNDALNSAVSNERDLGVVFYWAPARKRELFSHLVNAGLKGSGDYGVFALGVYNGQTANRPEVNNKPHLVARLSYPFEFKNKQVLELGIQAFTGEVQVTKSASSVKGETLFLDRRVAGSLMWYPQPLGVMAEYTLGEGPEYNPNNNTIESQRLYGGYAQVMYLHKHKKQTIIPFARYQYYKGGKKHETDARRHLVKELELGAEWQMLTNFEITTTYVISDRTFEDASIRLNRQQGNLLRIQAQLNF
jgi:hypothetical protein